MGKIHGLRRIAKDVRCKRHHMGPRLPVQQEYDEQEDGVSHRNA